MFVTEISSFEELITSVGNFEEIENRYVTKTVPSSLSV